METWELTEYEQERKPQEITVAEMAISPRSLYREIICPICLDILSHTRAAPDCLHRFCKKCIDKAIKKECPVCHKKLPSKVKSFKEDPKFDQLIARIYNGDHDRPQESSKVIIAPECEIILRPLNGGLTRFIKCPDTTTVEHLSKYLSIRPDGSKMPELKNKNEEYKLCIAADRSKGHYEKLPVALKLDEIKSTYKLESNKPLELYFFVPNKE